MMMAELNAIQCPILKLLDIVDIKVGQGGHATLKLANQETYEAWKDIKWLILDGAGVLVTFTTKVNSYHHTLH